MNSNIIGLLAKSINQTINIQVGDLKKIPIIQFTRNAKEEMSELGELAFEIKSKLIDLPLTLLESSSATLRACDLSAILEDHIKLHSRLTEELCSVQTDIDSKVIEAMEESGLIDSAERQVLFGHISLSEKQMLDEKQCAYKMLNSLVSNVISTIEGDRLVLVPLVDAENLSKLLNLACDGLDWFENKLGISIKKIFSQPKLIDISKLAREPSRYFSYYLVDYNTCMFFSSAAIRHLRKTIFSKDTFTITELSDNLDLCDKVKTIWTAIFEKLDGIEDWTSKDLASVFKLTAI